MNSTIEFIKKYNGFIFFVLFVISTVLFFQSQSARKKEKKEREFEQTLNAQNTRALIDSIEVKFDKKLKAYIFTHNTYVVNELAELKKYNKELAAELKKIKGDVLVAIKTQVKGDLGGLTAANKLRVLDPKTNHYGLDFDSKYSDLGFEQYLAGTSKFYVIPDETTKKWTIKPDTTVFDVNITKLKITYGIKESEKNRNQWQVFAISGSNKIQIEDLTGGYFIDKQITKPIKVKKWGIGPYVGYGLNTATNLNDPNFGLSIGFGIHYSILQW